MWAPVWTWFLLVHTAAGVAASAPHIVAIIADDLGWNDVGFHGSNQIPTPNIDALAYNGVILNRHYTLPTCTPSRTAYLTGRYPIRSGMQGFPIKANEPRGLPLSEVTLPDRLKQLGYVTRMVGKWHQGSYRTEFTPTRRGFDSFLGYWHGFIGYFAHTNEEVGKDGLDFHRDLCITRDYEGQYATDVFTQEAVDIIKHHDKSRPLYLHLAHLAVHAGNVAKAMEVPDEEAAHKKFSYIKSPERRLYAEMVSQLDDSVGDVVKALSDRGIINNTIIIFMTDNGAQTQGMFANWGSNWPLRGLKLTLHEGGVRGVAAIWSSAFHQPGRVSNQLFHLTDWLPTLYSAAGGKASDLGDIDGVDQWPSLVNKKIRNSSPRRQLLVNIDDVSNLEALISNNWKIARGHFQDGVYDGYWGENGRGVKNPPYNTEQILNSDVNGALKSSKSSLDAGLILSLRSKSEVVCNDTGVAPQKCEFCLYDLVKDPCERVDVSAENVKVVDELTRALRRYRKSVVPEINQDTDDEAHPALHGDMWVSWMDDPGFEPKCARESSQGQCSYTDPWFMCPHSMHRKVDIVAKGIKNINYVVTKIRKRSDSMIGDSSDSASVF